LLRLVTWDRLACEQICAIASRAHQPIKIGSVGAVVHGLRKKLAEHKIKIDAVNGFRFEVGKKDREKVRELLASATVEDPPEAQGRPPVRFSRGGLYSALNRRPTEQKP
jgi:hypothetical protein